MKRIRNCRIILLFIFLAGVSLFIATDLAYCSTKDLIELLNREYKSLMKEDREAAVEFKKEVANLRGIKTDEVETARRLEQLETNEDRLGAADIGAETRANNAAITDRKFNSQETVASGSSSGGGDTPVADPNPPAPPPEVN